MNALIVKNKTREPSTTKIRNNCSIRREVTQYKEITFLHIIQKYFKWLEQDVTIQFT